jgi:DNA-binding MarR family transcriptional regulator
MGGMMNGHNVHQASTSSPYLWTIPTVLAGVALASTGGLAYFLLFPEIRTTKPADRNLQHHPIAARSVDKNAQRDPIPAPPIMANSELGKTDETATQKSSLDPYTAVLRTLTPEERKVVEVLASHDGKYLQKHIRREAGLSRLKTHRILARLADRGMVSLEKSGNTNEVLLSNWLKTTPEGTPTQSLTPG